MRYEFISQNLNYEDFVNSEMSCGQRILIENNKDNIQKIFEFLRRDTSILLSVGFLGTGKTQIISNIVEKFNSDVVTLWANCYEATNLDDIFLTFFEEFKKLSMQGVINTPQAKFENFAQRINAYFYSISKPIVIVLDAFGNMNSENAKPVLDFITHLSSFKKIKTIIISRNFDRELLPVDVKVEKITFKALNKSLFDTYLSESKILYLPAISDELYKVTKGYFFYVSLAIRIIQIRQIKALDLLTAQSNSFMSAREFLFRDYFYLFSDSKDHLIRFLTIIRYPVTANLLKELQLYDENKIISLAQNGILDINNGKIYLKDYYKEVTEGEIPKNIMVKLHQSCIDLFELQLPLKPESRNLLISRRTIRQEIEYHKIFVPKKFEFNNSIEVYNSQALMIKPELLIEGQLQNKNEKAKIEEVITVPESKVKPKSLKDILFVFNEEEENSLLDGIAESINDFMEHTKSIEEAENSMGINELLKSIDYAVKNYEHKRAISLCKKALQKTEEVKLKIKLNTIIAQNYEKISDIYNAEKYYINAKNICIEQKDIQNSLEFSYKIAKMNFIMFKRDYAKEILLGLNKAQSKILRIKSELLLFDIYMEEDDKEKAFQACKTAMSLADFAQKTEMLCELLYKCGLILELGGQTTRAIDAYEKALKYSEDSKVNKYLPQIYSSLSVLYPEAGGELKAKDYARKFFEISKLQNDKEGLYLASLKLAELNEGDSIENVCNLYEKTYNYAKNTSDNMNIITALLQWGDYIYDKGLVTEALDKYLQAYQVAKNNLLKESLISINLRIKEIKFRLNEDTFNKKLKEYNYA